MQTGISKYLNRLETGSPPGVDISLSSTKCSSASAKISPPHNLYQIWQQTVARTG